MIVYEEDVFTAARQTSDVFTTARQTSDVFTTARQTPDVPTAERQPLLRMDGRLGYGGDEEWPTQGFGSRSLIVLIPPLKAQTQQIFKS